VWAPLVPPQRSSWAELWYKGLYNHCGSLRNYYISMVIYADPIHVCTPSSIQRLTGYAGVILFCVNCYWFTPYLTWLVRWSNELSWSGGVTFIPIMQSSVSTDGARMSASTHHRDWLLKKDMLSTPNLYVWVITRNVNFRSCSLRKRVYMSYVTK